MKAPAKWEYSPTCSTAGPPRRKPKMAIMMSASPTPKPSTIRRRKFACISSFLNFLGLLQLAYFFPGPRKDINARIVSLFSRPVLHSVSFVGHDPVAEFVRFAQQLLEIIAFGDFGNLAGFFGMINFDA